MNIRCVIKVIILFISFSVFGGENRVVWEDTSDNETGFVLESTVNYIEWEYVAKVGANVTEYTDVGLAAGTYGYRVRSYNSYGSSEYSNIAMYVVVGE